MDRPYLLQRLKKPYQKVEGEKANMMRALANAFSFGGGKKNGGISDSAMKLLNEIWRYDYMGSSEFEWGAVPESLQHIAKNIKEYTSGEFTVTAKERNYMEKKFFEKSGSVYYFCDKKDEQEVRSWIEKFADDIKHDYSTKESVKLASSMCDDKYNKDTVGWHDIDNHYLFFTDKEMFDNFTNLITK